MWAMPRAPPPPSARPIFGRGGGSWSASSAAESVGAAPTSRARARIPAPRRFMLRQSLAASRPSAILSFSSHPSFSRRCVMMGILGWLVFGLVVGALAKLIMPGKDPGGFVVTTLLGIVGAVVGGFLGRLVGLYKEGEPAGFVGALLGAILLLWIYRKTRKPAPAA